jgi:hypothetical protein
MGEVRVRPYYRPNRCLDNVVCVCSLCVELSSLEFPIRAGAFGDLQRVMVMGTEGE